MTSSRARVLIGLVALAAAISACSSSTDNAGPDEDSTGPTGAATVGSSPPASTTHRPAPGSSSRPATSTPAHPGRTTHPVPAAPIKTATVKGRHAKYVIQVWADVTDPTCFDHAYGQPVITYLTTNPCRGLDRRIGTTTVGGREVGFDQSVLTFSGAYPGVNRTAGNFQKLVSKDGTGNVKDLLREKYRLPNGPTAIPYPDAFTALVQDNGVTITDAWYLDGSTQNNDKALVTMERDIFLQF